MDSAPPPAQVASESVLVDQTVDLLNIADDTKFSMFWTSVGERGNGTSSSDD